jgi:hypothetical protein
VALPLDEPLLEPELLPLELPLEEPLLEPELLPEELPLEDPELLPLEDPLLDPELPLEPELPCTPGFATAQQTTFWPAHGYGRVSWHVRPLFGPTHVPPETEHTLPSPLLPHARAVRRPHTMRNAIARRMTGKPTGRGDRASTAAFRFTPAWPRERARRSAAERGRGA